MDTREMLMTLCGVDGNSGNERCDKLAVEAYNSENLKKDEGFTE